MFLYLDSCLQTTLFFAVAFGLSLDMCPATSLFWGSSWGAVRWVVLGLLADVGRCVLALAFVRGRAAVPWVSRRLALGAFTWWRRGLRLSLHNSKYPVLTVSPSVHVTGVFCAVACAFGMHSRPSA